MEPGVGGECKVEGTPSSRNSTFINLPCLELGGGGFRLPADICDASPTSPLLSSSGSDISWDVRGDSGGGPCTVSKSE